MEKFDFFMCLWLFSLEMTSKGHFFALVMATLSEFSVVDSERLHSFW